MYASVCFACAVCAYACTQIEKIKLAESIFVSGVYGFGADHVALDNQLERG